MRGERRNRRCEWVSRCGERQKGRLPGCRRRSRSRVAVGRSEWRGRVARRGWVDGSRETDRRRCGWVALCRGGQKRWLPGRRRRGRSLYHNRRRLPPRRNGRQLDFARPLYAQTVSQHSHFSGQVVEGHRGRPVAALPRLPEDRLEAVGDPKPLTKRREILHQLVEVLCSRDVLLPTALAIAQPAIVWVAAVVGQNLCHELGALEHGLLVVVAP